MGLLNQSYINTTLGQNVLKKPRKYLYFSADDKIGVMDDEYYLIFKPHSELTPQLFHYKSNSTVNLAPQFPQKVDSMTAHATNFIQASCKVLGY